MRTPNDDGSLGRSPDPAIGPHGPSARRVRRPSAPIVVALAAACALLSSCSPRPAGPSALARGETLYRQICAACHGFNGEGVHGLGADLRASDWVTARGDAELVRFLAEGRPARHPDNRTGVDMPPRGGDPSLTDEDLAAIAAYVRSLR